jgi:nicotinamidase-related amidase
MQQIDWKIRLMAVVGILTAGMGLSAPAWSQTIVDEWATVKAPPPPELKPVTIDPKVTALLMLDPVRQSCNTERRPRCIGSLPKIQALLGQARANGTMIIYTHYTGSAVGDILKEVVPSAGETVLGGTTGDKFIRTDLEQMLKDKGIKTVMLVGTAAEGAIILTGSAAAMRGFDVIVPVDGVSSSSLYAEQYTAWHFKNAPTISQRTTLTRTDLVGY